MCADLISGSGVVCDIGTDHAYLAVYLIQKGICGQVIASDVRDGPLKSAQINVLKHGLQNNITLMKSDGLEGIPLSGVSDVVIAGMGGETIIKILSACKNISDGINLILQPMSKPERLRAWLYQNGYAVIRETAAKSCGFIYTALLVKHIGGEIKYDCSMEYLGKLDLTLDIAKEYAENCIKKLRKRYDGLKMSNEACADEALKILQIADELDSTVKGAVLHENG